MEGFGKRLSPFHFLTPVIVDSLINLTVKVPLPDLVIVSAKLVLDVDEVGLIDECKELKTKN